MMKVAILSYWHVHAKDYTKQAIAHPDTEIAAVWDENPKRGQQEAAKLSVPFYASLDDVLAQPEIDGVIVVTPTNIHRDVMVKAAKAGKHIFTEKVLALTLKETEEILAAVNENGVKLTVSLPRLNDNYTLAIQDVLRQGLLGTLSYARVRLSHNGAIANWLPEHFYNLEQCGGGALADLGCHPLYLTRLFLGVPESVSANYGYTLGKEVEDHAVSVFRYANGAIGVAEAGFVNNFSPFSIEIHGTEGSLLYGLPDDQLRIRSKSATDNSWQIYELPQTRASAFEQWVQHIQQNTTAEENIQIATDLTKLVEASNLSAKQNQAVRIADLHH